MIRSLGHSVDVSLAELLEALAPVLLALDITPARLEVVARAAFVKSSATNERVKSSGRPHLARIAAHTGLTRSEVKRLVATNYRTESSSLENLPRALRVLNGWRSSKIYAKNGKPNPLRILGKSPNFLTLCKSYSGDIPYKVILDDLEKRQLVVVSRKLNRVAIARPTTAEIRNSKSQNALAFAASFLGDALADEVVLVRRAAKIGTSRQLPDAYVETAVASRITDLLDQLPQLYVRRKGSKRNIVNVFALVSRNQKRR